MLYGEMSSRYFTVSLLQHSLKPLLYFSTVYCPKHSLFEWIKSFGHKKKKKKKVLANLSHDTDTTRQHNATDLWSDAQTLHVVLA